MSIQLKRTDSNDADFLKLVKLLDKELAFYNGDQDSFFAQYNTIAYLNNVVLVYEDELPSACGAFKKYNDDTVEIKRMYVDENCRRKGYAAIVLSELESWAKENGYVYTILETGDFLPGTVSFYSKSGYSIIPNYDQYAGVKGSVCFKKELI